MSKQSDFPPSRVRIPAHWSDSISRAMQGRPVHELVTHLFELSDDVGKVHGELAGAEARIGELGYRDLAALIYAMASLRNRLDALYGTAADHFRSRGLTFAEKDSELGMWGYIDVFPAED